MKDLSDAIRDAEALGFRRMRPLESKILGTEGEEFETARGKIILLRANTSDGPAAQFACDRGEGVLGVTLDAIDIAKVHALIEKNVKRTLPLYAGFYGNSFLVPAELACGVWIEMVQK